MKSSASVNVYLILQKEEKVLLSLRDNAGYQDGMWGLVAGHQEVGESATTAMIREAKEEANIDIKEEDLHVSHIMHRKTDRENIDVFFVCNKWSGVLNNNEPNKCAKLEFFATDELPDNFIGYIKEAIKMISTNTTFSELGWS